MLTKPNIYSNENDLVNFVSGWIKLCAEGRIEEAFSILDQPIEASSNEWSPEDIEEITFNHFNDGKQPIITSPDCAEGTIRKDVFAYDDGSGWGVQYDLPMNGVVSDFTLMFNFIKKNNQLLVILDDCHVM